MREVLQLAVQCNGRETARTINQMLKDHPTAKVTNVFPVNVTKIGGVEAEAVIIFEEPTKASV